MARLHDTSVAAAVGVLLAQLVVGDVSARGGYRDHGRSHLNFGFYWGAPFYWGPEPYYYPRRPIIVQPPVYIERQAPVYREPPAPLWYYCVSPAGYYPYVQQCTQAWIPVDPRTVPPR
jgi:hypothetical protein